jgi:hypothetical protein
MGVFDLIKMATEDSRNKLEQQRMANELSRRQLDAQTQLSNLATEIRPMDRVPGAPLAILGMEGEHIGYAPGLPGVIPSETPEVPALHTRAGRGELVGLAANIAPGATATNLLGGRQTERMRIGEMLGLRDQELVDFMTTGQQTGLEGLIAEMKILETQSRMLEREEQSRIRGEEQAQLRKERRAENAKKQNLVLGSVGTLQDMYAAMKQLAPYNIMGNPLVSENAARPLVSENAARFASLAPDQMLASASQFGMGQALTPTQLEALRIPLGDFGRLQSNVVLNTSASLEGIRPTVFSMSTIEQSKPSLDRPAQSNFNGMRFLMEQELLNDNALDDEFRMSPSQRKWLEGSIAEIDERQAAINEAVEVVRLAQSKGRTDILEDLRQRLIADGISPSEVGL